MIIKVKARNQNGKEFDLILTGEFISTYSFRCYGSNIVFRVEKYEVVSDD